MGKNPDCWFNRMRKSGKTEFFEVHTESAVITHLNSVVRHIPHFFSYMRACHGWELTSFDLNEGPLGLEPPPPAKLSKSP